jgi:hypothetical protein
MGSESPHNGRTTGGPHKPFLIDPALEGTRPPGVDATSWAQLLGLLQFLVPRRFRGLPPLFYPPSLAGILYGAVFLFALVSSAFGGDASSVGDSYGAEPSEVGPVADALWYGLVTLVFGLGLVQSIGVLLRKHWGLVAAYAWLSVLAASPWVLCWLEGEFSMSPVDALLALLWSTLAVCWVVYYHNRRLCFTVSARP